MLHRYKLVRNEISFFLSLMMHCWVDSLRGEKKICMITLLTSASVTFVSMRTGSKEEFMKRKKIYVWVYWTSILFLGALAPKNSYKKKYEVTSKDLSHPLMQGTCRFTTFRSFFTEKKSYYYVWKYVPACRFSWTLITGSVGKKNVVSYSYLDELLHT